jgi:putative IMPACT (imprinted ancient) family translation regulator
MCGVVRYFGGIKLGVPGLIAAYTAATQNALSSAHIIEYVEYAQCSFSFGYPHTSGVELTLARANASRIAESFTEICTFTVRVRKDVLPQLEAGLAPYVTSFRVLPPED